MSNGKYKDYCCPIYDNFKITSEHGWRGNPSGNEPRVAQHHYGTDMGNAHDKTIYAIADGVISTVVRPKPNVGQYGYDPVKHPWTQGQVSIRHDDGGPITKSDYIHVKQGSIPLNLKKGVRVKKGDPIAVVGNTGQSFGSHLHLQLYEGGRMINARSFLEDVSDVYERYRPIGPYKLKDKKGIERTVYRTKVTFKAKGRYKSSRDPNATAPPPEAVLEPVPDGPPGTAQTPSSATAPGAGSDGTDPEDINNSLLSFYLPAIVQSSFAKQSSLYNNIIEIDGGENTPILSNLILSKQLIKQGNTDYNDISTLELSSLTPFVELYSVKGNNQEILYPFDDYTTKEQIQTIFYDKTTRGGSVGVQNVEFKTIATNPANKAQISVRVKLLVQDIAQIETPRNGITLLDFLYPAASRNTSEYVSRNFSVKMKVGWKYKKENILLNDLNKKIDEDLLTQVLYCSLHNHSFDFRDDGLVELTMEYIGMIEAEIADPYSKNVLDDLSISGTALIRTVNGWKKVLEDIEQYGKDFQKLSVNYLSRSDIFDKKIEKANFLKGTDIKLDENNEYVTKENRHKVSLHSGKPMRHVTKKAEDNEIETRVTGENITYDLGEGDKKLTLDEDGINQLKTDIQEKIKQVNLKVAQEFAKGLADFVKSVSDKKKIKVLSVTQDNINSLIQINNGKAIAYEKFESEIKDIKSLRDSFESGSLSVEPTTVDEVNKSINFQQASFAGDRYSINSTDYVSRIVTGQTTDGQVNIPYILLKDILSYYHAKFYGTNADEKQRPLSIFMGSFTYTELESVSIQRSTKAYKSSDVTSNVVVDKQGNAYFRPFTSEKTANMGNIPISLKNFIDWYNTTILNSNFKNMSYHSFMRKILTELINASVTSNLASFERRTNVISSFNYLTVKPDKKIMSEIAKKRIDFSTKKNYKASSFYRLLDKAVYRKENNVSTSNFLFIFSKNESMPSLEGAYKSDQ